MTTNNNKVSPKLAQLRITAIESSEKRLQNKIAVNALRQSKFKSKAALPKFAHTDLATFHVGVALLRCAYQPTPEFLTLCTHPLHLLLWSQSPNRAQLLSQAAPLLAADDEPLELQSLAQLLKKSLPKLVTAFQSDQLPQSAWLLICRKLIAVPVLGHPLVHLQAEHLYKFQITQRSDTVANSIWFALTAEQKSAYFEYSTSFFIPRWFKEKLHWLKQAVKISKAETKINQ